MSRDPRIDAYIERAQDFAKPILSHIRETMHAACPDIGETLKWGMPTFTHKGRNIAGMASFKAHASFGFWRRSEVGSAPSREGEAMGQFGRIASRADLPGDTALAAMVRDAVALEETGVRPKRAKTPPKAEIAMPGDFRSALDADPRASTAFDAFPPGARRDYLEWVTQAKRPETRAKRIATAAKWIAEGKKRHWKYESC